MAQSSARCNSCQNPHDGKDKFASGTFTKVIDRRIPALATTRAPTLTVVPVVAPLAAFGSANSFVVRYLKDDLQRILRIVLDSRSPVSFPAVVVVAAPHFESPRERLLKAWFSDIYWGKTHVECYNFFQQCKDHFTTAGATGQNGVPFAATFLKNTALF